MMIVPIVICTAILVYEVFVFVKLIKEMGNDEEDIRVDNGRDA